MPDFRARERTFQLIAQVAGRAGRGEKPGYVLVQTFRPDEPAIVLATQHDYEAFARQELRDRHTAGYPPFGRLVLITAEGKDEEKTGAALADLATRIRTAAYERSDLQLLGPAPAALSKLRDKYRWQIIAKARNARMVRTFVADSLRPWRPPSGIKVTVDVDPADMM